MKTWLRLRMDALEIRAFDTKPSGNKLSKTVLIRSNLNSANNP